MVDRVAHWSVCAAALLSVCAVCSLALQQPHQSLLISFLSLKCTNSALITRTSSQIYRQELLG